MTTTAYAVTATDAGLDDRPAAPDHLAAPGHVTAGTRLDDHEVYCSEAELWAPAEDLFCQFCGAADHDLR